MVIDNGQSAEPFYLIAAAGVPGGKQHRGTLRLESVDLYEGEPP